MNILGLISQLIGIKTLRLTSGFQGNLINPTQSKYLYPLSIWHVFVWLGIQFSSCHTSWHESRVCATHTTLIRYNLKYCVLSLCQVLTHPNHDWLSPIFNPGEPNHEIEGGFWVILTDRSVDNDVNMFPTRSCRVKWQVDAKPN